MKNYVKSGARGLKATWYVWLFPILALGICAFLFMRYLDERGPEIKIRFDDGSAIQAEKTRIRFRGVTIGTIKRVEISPDNKEVIAYANLHKDAEHFAVQGSKFWVVSPKVNFQGVSGLETIFEGTYIAATPGTENAGIKTDFDGRLSGDIDSLEDTVAYYLETANAESYNPGDSVTFRGVKVGSITKVVLTKTAQAVVLQVNVQSRYTRLIRTNTIFWRKVGVRAKLGLFNSELTINSMESILHGGIEFFTPNEAGPIAKVGSKFALNAEPPKDYQKWNPKLGWKDESLN